MEVLAVIVALFIVAVMIVLPFRLGNIQDRLKAIEIQNRQQTELLAGILRALRELHGKPAALPASPEKVLPATEKELSLSGYNR